MPTSLNPLAVATRRLAGAVMLVSSIVFTATAAAPVTDKQLWSPRELTRGLVRVDAIMVPEGRTVSVLGQSRSGSGVMLDQQTVLTIGYLVLEADEVMLTTAGGKRIPASVAAYDHATGLGLVRAALPLDGNPIPFGDSTSISESDRLLAVGSFDDSPAEVVVVSRRPFSGSWEYLLERPIYTFPPLADWSGLALTNQQGELVGIGSLRLDDVADDRAGVRGNLFVPTELLLPILHDLQTRGSRQTPPQPWLGVTTQMFESSLVAVRLAVGGPAEKAGLKPGDEIIAVGGLAVLDQADFYRKVWQSGSAGSLVPLTIKRDEQRREINIRSVDRMSYLKRPEGV